VEEHDERFNREQKLKSDLDAKFWNDLKAAVMEAAKSLIRDLVAWTSIRQPRASKSPNQLVSILLIDCELIWPDPDCS
jgi:hypothetical protein